MRRKSLYTIQILLAMALSGNAATFGNWKNYMAYNDITDIEPAGKIVYVLSSNSLFSYNNSDGSITTYDKVYPLSDCNISKIAWNNNVKKLIVVYSNANIDILDNNGNTINVSGLHDKTMTESKAINNVVINGNMAYICTAFGLVQVNMESGLIMDTFNMGRNILNCAFNGDCIYAQTDNGILKGDRKENLVNPSNWNITTDNVSFAHPNDINVTTDNGYTQYYTYDNTNKCYWTNQSDNKLQAYTIADDGTKTITKQDIAPESPVCNDLFGFMTVVNGKLYTCNGRVWDSNRDATIQVYFPTQNTWKVYDNKGISEKYGLSYKDVLCLAVDPRDNSHVMAGTQTGIYEFQNGVAINHFDRKNSLITPIEGLDDNYQLVTSMAYDSNNNLWIANSGGKDYRIIAYTADKKWSAPNKQIEKSLTSNAKITIDKNGRIWVTSGLYGGNGVSCYSADLQNIYTYTTFINEDGTSVATTEAIRQATEDKDGNIWIPTGGGLLTLTDEYQRNPSLGFYQVKVPRNDGTNYADYLLGTTYISCIAVDNANRKWIGTQGDGVYVISSDNMIQEAHFTAEECSLLSNNISYIAIDQKSGTVYISTDDGLCSVESNATETFDNMDKDNVWAYPNPVRPDYTGLITVVGLSFNADVKITTTSGTLVAQGRSTGGSFQWDGKDLKGKRVASGIYMVNTATEGGESGTVCKIAIIN